MTQSFILKVFMIFLNKSLNMGSITSFCCQQDNDKNSNRQVAPKVKKRKAKGAQAKIGKENACALEKEHLLSVVENPQRLKDMQIRTEEEIMKEIEENYPLPADKQSLCWEHFEISHRIGAGGFGEVFLGEVIQNKRKGKAQKYAIKRIPKSEVFKKKLMTSIKLQRKILLQSSCNFITPLHYAFRDTKYLYLVMEWAEGGDVLSLIDKKGTRMHDFWRAGENAVRFILACVILGVEHLHSKNIVYRDLKPQNVLIFNNGYVKLTDFGLAKKLEKDQLTKTQAGTMMYYAPEMVLKQGYGKQLDLWTLGILAYEISNYSPPFAGPEINDSRKVKRLVKYAESNRRWVNKNLSEQLKDFISSLLKFQPSERLGSNSWQDIKNHKFFTCANFNWTKLKEMKMKSPLKKIIKDHKIQYKVYQQKNVAEVVPKSHQDEFYYTWSKHSIHQ